MTDSQKNEVVRLRREGQKYAEIAESLGLSINTVKSYYRRMTERSEDLCRFCKTPIVQQKGTRQKKFCSDVCRMKWWKSHGCDVKRKAVYSFQCACCGKAFEAYGNNHRKYCSRSCYIRTRFGGTGDE